MTSPKVEVVLKGCHSTIGEGPHWDVPTQSLYTVDILNGGVYRWDSRTGKEDKINLNDSVGFVIPRQEGGLVVGLGRTVASLNFDTKATEVLAEVEAGTMNRFNDGKCDAAGRLWAGTMGAETTPGVVPEGAGSLYCLDTNLKLTNQDSGISISNGMDWTDDNSTMYYIDSVPKVVYAYNLDHANGNISNRHTVVDLAASGVDGLPDGMCIDCEGKIWVAVFSGSKVVRFDPVTGKVMTTVDFPVTNITSCCFGGPQLDELFVTCSNWKLPMEQPLAGSVFKVTGLGVKGRAAFNFCG